MMIDINPCCGADGFARGAETILDGCIQRNAKIECLGSCRWPGEGIAAGHEAVFLQHSVFIPDGDILAEFAQREPERELAAEGVTVRADVAEHRDPLMSAKRGRDLCEAGVRHDFSDSDSSETSSPASGSISSRIWIMRAPRSVESSR